MKIGHNHNPRGRKKTQEKPTRQYSYSTSGKHKTKFTTHLLVHAPLLLFSRPLSLSLFSRVSLLFPSSLSLSFSFLLACNGTARIPSEPSTTHDVLGPTRHFYESSGRNSRADRLTLDIFPGRRNPTTEIFRAGITPVLYRNQLLPTLIQ